MKWKTPNCDCDYCKGGKQLVCTRVNDDQTKIPFKEESDDLKELPGLVETPVGVKEEK